MFHFAQDVVERGLGSGAKRTVGNSISWDTDTNPHQVLQKGLVFRKPKHVADCGAPLRPYKSLVHWRCGLTPPTSLSSFAERLYKFKEGPGDLCK